MRSTSQTAAALAQSQQRSAALVASRVLDALQRRAGSRPRRAAPRPCHVKLAVLVDACLGAHFDSRETVQALRESELTRCQIADVYIPAAARQLGCDWLDDTLSFAQVTVASARLQTMLGSLDTANDFMPAYHRGRPNVLVISFEDDHHTLGWKLITLQLRRRGACAHALVDVTAADAAEALAQSDYDVVLVSASRRDVLDSIDTMLAHLRTRTPEAPPIVLGGIVLDQLDADECHNNIVNMTNCLDTALSFRKLASSHDTRT